MAVWETDDEYLSGPAATSLPTPHDTPYRTPSRASRASRASRKSRRSVTPPNKSRSPPPLPNERGDKSSKRSSRDVTTDETISILDPRRFTPTLHASLVSEILSLRRDQEDKTRLIESLEASLHSSKEEHESLQGTHATAAKENRSLKRQLALLEGGTSSALGELARERDEAVDSVSDTKKRLEAAQKKIRTQEDDSQRVHDQWALEKDSWEEEKRKYERKVHIAESRLKMVLDEVAAYQAAQAAVATTQAGGAQSHESDAEESGRETDTGSIRSVTNRVRYSLLSEPGFAKPNGNSLADELNFDDDDDQTDIDGRDSVLSNYTYRHTRNMSRDSVLSRLHRRNMSLESPKRPGSVVRGRLFMNQSVLEALEGEDEETQAPQPKSYADAGVQCSPEPSPKPTYTDTGFQDSPPPSPKALYTDTGVQDAPEIQPKPVYTDSGFQDIPPTQPKPSYADTGIQISLAPLSNPSQAKSATPAKTPEAEHPRGDTEIEANQRRKRVHINRPHSFEPSMPRLPMVSAASQTIEAPLSPPRTPRSPRSSTPPSPSPPKTLPMMTSATQTDLPSPPPTPKPAPPPPAIPSISIQPPTSRPSSPQEPRLPQHSKDFGCQVNLASPIATSEASVQTEGIQIDKRLARLPAHLQPSSITSRPTSPNPAAETDADKNFSPVPGNLPPRNPRRLTAQRGLTDVPSSPISEDGDERLHDAYPGNNDDGPLSSQKAPMRRPHRFSSLFAGFADAVSSDEIDEFDDGELSDSEYRTALSAPRPRSNLTQYSKRSSQGTAASVPTSPEQVFMRQGPRNSVRPIAAELSSPLSPTDKDGLPKKAAGKSARAFEKSPANMSSNRAPVMRKAAMIQSGIATHQGRPRSPSLPEAGNPPPFPIPTRASSRKPPFSSSAPSDGQRSPTRRGSSHRRSGGSGQPHYRSNSIRKVRSAAALPRNQRHRRHGSTPPLSPSTEAPESPGLPPLPKNDITTPRRDRPSYPRHRRQQSGTTDNTNITDMMSQTSAPQQQQQQSTSVVDAIAQTMVGEWMFKYVRRRRSFGMMDSTGKDDSSNDRHKRWVWLAPYERAILWSSKQPASGTALMGKAGRKRKSSLLEFPPPIYTITTDRFAVTIQSVLDVKDENPAPKGMQPVFDRSILILTPQRALKFTATTAERHYIWLTALSFLAHSSQAVPEIVTNSLAPPKHAPLPEFDAQPTKLKRGGIRDSIRLAKGRPARLKPALPNVPDIPDMPSPQMGDVASYRMPDSAGAAPSSYHSREDSQDAAEPPMIPRFHERNGGPPAVHGRKRSNTGGHVPPPLSFRGFSSPVASSSHHAPTNSTAGASIGTADSSDIYHSQTSSNKTWGMSQTASQRTSEASSRPSNFFDAIGTVRMEAFISPLAFSQFNDYPDEQEEFRKMVRRRSKDNRRRRSRSRNRDSYNSRSTRGTDDYYGGSRTAGEEDFFREDPFKGF